MKCRTRVITTNKVKDEVAKEWARTYDETFEKIKADIVAQVLATCCCELNKEFGFGRKRLQRFKDGTEDLFVMMQKNGIMGKKFTTDTCIDYMSELGIDFKARR